LKGRRRKKESGLRGRKKAQEQRVADAKGGERFKKDMLLTVLRTDKGQNFSN
jgi:hypothetical protein